MSERNKKKVSRHYTKDIMKLKRVEINYSTMSEARHYALYNNNVGSFDYKDSLDERTTKMVGGRYHKSSERKNFMEKYGKPYKTIYNNNGIQCNIKTLDGRIIAAMPLNLLLKTDEDVLKSLYTDEMHVDANYNDGGFKNGGQVGYINSLAENNKKYKVVDVIIGKNYNPERIKPNSYFVDVKYETTSGEKITQKTELYRLQEGGNTYYSIFYDKIRIEHENFASDELISRTQEKIFWDTLFDVDPDFADWQPDQDKYPYD